MKNYTAKQSGRNTWLVSDGVSPWATIVRFIYSDFYNGLGQPLPGQIKQWCIENLKVSA